LALFRLNLWNFWIFYKKKAQVGALQFLFTKKHNKKVLKNFFQYSIYEFQPFLKNTNGKKLPYRS
jgi:hypothetical protein